jgi:hypothetical protein
MIQSLEKIKAYFNELKASLWDFSYEKLTTGSLNLRCIILLWRISWP